MAVIRDMVYASIIQNQQMLRKRGNAMRIAMIADLERGIRVYCDTMGIGAPTLADLVDCDPVTFTPDEFPENRDRFRRVTKSMYDSLNVSLCVYKPTIEHHLWMDRAEYCIAEMVVFMLSIRFCDAIKNVQPYVAHMILDRVRQCCFCGWFCDVVFLWEFLNRAVMCTAQDIVSTHGLLYPPLKYWLERNEDQWLVQLEDGRLVLQTTMYRTIHPTVMFEALQEGDRTMYHCRYDEECVRRIVYLDNNSAVWSEAIRVVRLYTLEAFVVRIQRAWRRVRAARRIKLGLRPWLEKPFTRDGRLGIRLRIIINADVSSGLCVL